MKNPIANVIDIISKPRMSGPDGTSEPERITRSGPSSHRRFGHPWFLASTKILNPTLRAIYPLKNPAKPVQKTNSGKRIIFIGGALMALLYFRKHPEKADNLKDEFYH